MHSASHLRPNVNFYKEFPYFLYIKFKCISTPNLCTCGKYFYLKIETLAAAARHNCWKYTPCFKMCHFCAKCDLIEHLALDYVEKVSKKRYAATLGFKFLLRS